MRPRLKPLDQQVILITGASSGIGLATARIAAGAGARVMLVSRDGEALARIAREIGDHADFATADVTDLRDVQRAATKAVERFGRIDTWVNAAGVAIYAKLVDTPMDEHEALWRTNYIGTVHGCLVAVEHLQREGGALISLGSIVSDIPSPGMGAYAASKHAVKGYIGSLRIEIEGDGLPIAVTLVKPSGTDTPVAQHAANHLDGEALLPPPVYDPDLVARAILDAAVRPTREVTVGGIGKLQVLTAQHFPALLDRFGAALLPWLRDPERAKTPGNNLDAPQGDNGRERSGVQPGRRTSVYAAAGRHPALTATMVGTTLGLAALAGIRSRRS